MGTTGADIFILRTPGKKKGQCPIMWTVEVLRSCLRLTLAGTGLRQNLSSNSARTTPSTAGRRFPAVSAYTSPKKWKTDERTALGRSSPLEARLLFSAGAPAQGHPLLLDGYFL